MPRENTFIIDLIIPAFNEEEAIGKVVSDVPKNIVREVIVVNNNSTDSTPEVAVKAGAKVIDQPLPGYGNACLKGLAYVHSKSDRPDAIVFLDGDYSDHPEELEKLVEPIKNNEADLVIGSRVLGRREKGSLTPQQLIGNRIATTLLSWFYGYRFTDLGPFRAIRYTALMQLDMKDQNYGWTVEMQIKAAKQKLKYLEVPVLYRNRIGQSKVSGTIKGSVLAGYKIILTLIKYV